MQHHAACSLAGSRSEQGRSAPVKRCNNGAICCPRPNRRSLIAVQKICTMLCSERHVPLNTADTAASSGLAAATMVLITPGGKSENLAREVLVTTMTLERINAPTSTGPLVRTRVDLAGPNSLPDCTGVPYALLNEVPERPNGRHACKLGVVVLCQLWHAWWVLVQGSCFHVFCFQCSG